jgi:hypothetical protein
MSPERRQHTITNTFNMLKFVKYADIQASIPSYSSYLYMLQLLTAS